MLGLGREQHRHPAVAELGAHRDVLRALGGEEDRDVLPQRVDRRLERLAEPGAAGQGEGIGGAVGGDRAVAAPDVAHDPDVLAGAGERLRERHAVPALDDLRAGSADAHDHAAAGEVVERHRGHRRRGRLARRQLHDPGAQPNVLGARAPPGQRREAVRAVRLGAPDRVDAEGVGCVDRLDHSRGRPLRPVAGVVAELQVAHRGADPIRES